MANILVTGATGFVGRQLVPALTRAGHHVRCAVVQKVDWLNAEQILVNRLEIQKDWAEALLDMDIVIHLAARVHQMREHQQSALATYEKINIAAVQNLAAQAAQHKIKRFIFLSSIKVNGEATVDGVAFTENDTPNPCDPYAQSKFAAEQCLQQIAQESAMEFVILRPPLVYGPGVKANFLRMMHLVKKGLPLPFKSLQNKRSFIYIDNLISAICAVLEDKKAANQLFLVADDKALTLPQMLHHIAQGMDNSVYLIPIPARVLAWVFNLIGLKGLHNRLLESLEVSTDKITSQLGWVPPVASLEGVEKTAQWYQHEFHS